MTKSLRAELEKTVLQGLQMMIQTTLVMMTALMATRMTGTYACVLKRRILANLAKHVYLQA